MDVGAALEAVRSSGTILEGLRAGERLEHAARRAAPGDVDLLLAATADRDPITAIAAVRALGADRSARAADHLVTLLGDDRAHIAEHAVEALGSVAPHPVGIAPLVRRCAEGGFTGMLAQRTLETWAASMPDAVHAGLAAALTCEGDPAGRTRLVETMGLVPGTAAARALLGVAPDATEPDTVRAAALAALGDLLAELGRRDAPEATAARATLGTVARSPGPLAKVATLALSDGLTAASTARSASAPSSGLTVVQLFLHGDVDGSLRHSGQGDTGGIATLLVHLGNALLRQGDAVGRVITLSGGWGDLSLGEPSAEGATPTLPPDEDLTLRGHRYVRIPLWGKSTGAATAWARRVEVRRGIRRVLRAAGRVDALHLRMADLGSMVGAEVAAELGIPVVLTLAPDPQALIAVREADGSLPRSDFAAADSVEHLWFRDRLVRDLAEQAAHLVLFPRPDVERSISRLVGVDVSRRPERVTVIGEGIDVVALQSVAKEVRGGMPRGPVTAAALEDLDALLTRLPPERRSLPLAVSVGRLAPVKGMATLVSAWLADPELRRRCNLLVIGGDLDDPTAEEAAELSRIHDAVILDESSGAGLVLAGHRPNATATTWLAAARGGRPGLSAPGGVYVCASLKEEFGIAILEAMAVALVVVAPDGGGPATYVDDGVTGVLTDTSRAPALAAGIGRALDLATSPGAELGGRRAKTMVRERFGIDTMAAALCEVYSSASSGRARGQARAATTP